MYADHQIKSLTHVTKNAIEFVGVSFMVWRCSSSSAVGPIHLITDFMTADITVADSFLS